jgi:hypothetical protein
MPGKTIFGTVMSEDKAEDAERMSLAELHILDY